VLFAGPGLSAQAGYPNRLQILESLVKEQRGLSESDRSELLGMLEPESGSRPFGTLEEVTEILASRVSRDQLLTTLRSLHGSLKSRPAPIFQDLKRVPFTSALTFNWDPLLEETFAERNPVVVTGTLEEAVSDAFNPQRFTIAKLHGQLDKPQSVRFTADDYRLALSENQSFSRILVSFVETQTLLFWPGRCIAWQMPARKPAG